jgi:hypothetical protein
VRKVGTNSKGIVKAVGYWAWRALRARHAIDEVYRLGSLGEEQDI